jgi:hypothetical protein
MEHDRYLGPLVDAMYDPDSEASELAFHTYVHELVHVSDIAKFTRTYPGGWQAAGPRDARDSAMQALVNSCQAEYTAQYHSAHCAPRHGFEVIQMLKDAMSDFEDQIFTARYDFERSKNWDELWNSVSKRVSFLFYAIGHTIGHLDAILQDEEVSEDLKTDYKTALEEMSAMTSSWIVHASREAVRPFLELKAWTGQEIYNGLIEVAERLLNEHGIYTHLSDEGAFALNVRAVPFTF